MTKGLLTLTLLLASLPLFAGTPSKTQPQAWKYPVIQNHGGVTPLPKAALQPNPRKTYKVVFNLTKDDGNGQINKGLEHVARAVNVFALSGVRAKQRQFLVVIHGPATGIVMKNDDYRKRNGRDNPNIALIHALRANGVKLFVCGQALAENHIPHSAVNPDITLSLSALSDLIILQQQGYVLYPL